MCVEELYSHQSKWLSAVQNSEPQARLERMTRRSIGFPASQTGACEYQHRQLRPMPHPLRPRHRCPQLRSQQGLTACRGLAQPVLAAAKLAATVTTVLSVAHAPSLGAGAHCPGLRSLYSYSMNTHTPTRNLFVPFHRWFLCSDKGGARSVSANVSQAS